MRVLVTGGAGFIGSHLVDLLVQAQREVSVLDNLDQQVHGLGAKVPVHLAAHIEGGAVRFFRGDVTDRSDVSAALQDVAAVVHLAAAVGVGQSMYRPKYYVHTNACGTGVLLDVLGERRGQVKKLVVASSMSLYGEGACRCPRCGGDRGAERTEARLAAGQWGVPCSECGEDMAPVPTPETKPSEIASIYAATKKHQEELCVAFGRAYGIATFALRFFNVYGARQSLNNPYTGVAAIFLGRLQRGQQPQVFEDGGQERDFVDVRDVARALVGALDHPGQGQHVLNIGTGRRVSILKVAKLLAECLGLTAAPQIIGRYRAGDIRQCIADTAAARRILGFEARHQLEGGLPSLVDWVRGQQPSATDGANAFDELEARGLVR